MKLRRFPWLCLMLAAAGGCGGGDETSSRTGTGVRAGTGGPSLGLAGSSSLPPVVPGTAGTGLAPIVPGNMTPLMDPDTCASARVVASRVTPTVHLVVDGSGSMNANFGGQGTRWQVLRNALVGQNGVVTRLESVVKFGLTIYSNNDPMTCPAISEVKPSLMNFNPITGAYPQVETGGGTPTGEALQRVVDSLPDYNAVGPDQKSEGPPIIVLATDGEPNGCANGVICNWIDWATCLTQLLGSLATAAPTYDTTLKAVRDAKAKGIQVWVVSLANGLNSIPDLQRTANIGAGLDENASPGATIYSPQNPDDLTNTLTKLIGDVVSCEVTLNGVLVVDRACEGAVEMNGTKLPCNDPQGWKPVDEKHITLQGQACESFKSDPTVTLDARFPCDVVRPQ